MTFAPAPFRRRSGLLANYWYAAALCDEVSSLRPVGRVVLGEMLVLWRTPEGRPVAMLDRCLHRNALLSEGDLFDGCIGCPYHGWTYDAEGRLVNIPSEGPSGRAPDTERRLPRFEVREQDGLLWVWMGIDAPPFGDPFRMPHYDEAGWGAYYMTTRFENNVTNLVENFMDVPHTVFVHQGWFRSRAKKRVPTTVERTDHSVLVSYDQPQDSIGFTERILNPKRLPMVHTDKFYMPNTTRVDYVFGDEARAFVITSTCTPISEYETEVYTLISYKLGRANALARYLLPAYTRKVIDQDVEIMQIQGRGLKHYGDHHFTSTSADTLHVHIEALRDWAAAGGQGPKPEPVTERMDFWILMAEVLYERPSVRVRLATEADNPALCDVVRRVHLRSALDVTQERDPDFFALPRMHQGAYDVFVAENPDGFVGGCGTVVVRDGWLDGEVRKVGYLSDLRAVPGFRGARALPAAYRAALERARDVHGAEVFYTVIFDDNQVAKKALLQSGRRRPGQPTYRVMTPFTMVAVQFTLPCPRPEGDVRRAGPADADALVEFLATRSRDRVMGDVLTPERFEERLALWPGLSLEDFFVARDGRGRIVGAVAPWDSHGFKRTRVLGYHGSMRALKRALSIGSALLRFPALPEPGECFRFFWMSHLEVEDDDPRVLRDLVRASYRALRSRRPHFLSAMVPVGSPLQRGFSGFVTNRTPMTVYSVTLDDSPFADRDLRTRRPGFEMALS